MATACILRPFNGNFIGTPTNPILPLYGTALLAGILLGELLGRPLGVQANVGSLGIADRLGVRRRL